MGCEDLTYDDLAPSLINPNTNPDNIRNLNYVQPDDLGTYQIRPFAYLAAYEFDYGFHYVHNSLRIVDNFGFEVSTLSVDIESTEYPYANLPMKGMPIYGLKWIVYNEDKSRVLFSGRGIDASRTGTLTQRPDGTDVYFFNLELQDFATFQFKRKKVKEIYENVTSHFLIVDACKKYAPSIDVSSIDTSKGDNIVYWKINGDRLYEVINKILSDEGLTVRFNHEDESIEILEIGSGSAVIMSIDDSTLYDVFDKKTFNITRNNPTLSNVGEYHYNRKIALKVNVTNSSPAVAVNVTFNPEVKLTKFVTNNGVNQSRIKISTSDQDYSIIEILNDTDFRISPDFDGATNSSGVEATILTRGQLIQYNNENVETMAAILGEEGEYLAGEFHGDIKKEDPMFEQEARDFLDAYLAAMSNYRVRGGKAETISFIDMGGLNIPRSGDSIKFSIPTSWGIDEEVIIRQVVIEQNRDAGGINPDSDVDSLLKYSFSFYDRIAIIENQLERLYRDSVETVTTNDDVMLTLIYQNENLILNDCVDVIAPNEVDEILELGDEIEIFELDTTTDWKTTDDTGFTPVGVAAYTWNLSNRALTSV